SSPQSLPGPPQRPPVQNSQRPRRPALRPAPASPSDSAAQRMRCDAAADWLPDGQYARPGAQRRVSPEQQPQSFPAASAAPDHAVMADVATIAPRPWPAGNRGAAVPACLYAVGLRMLTGSPRQQQIQRMNVRLGRG